MKPIIDLKRLLTKFIKNTGTRFVIAGGFNTLITYILYLLLVQFLTYRVAYTATFLTGIVLSYLLNAIWVFSSTLAAKSAIAYPFAYMVQYFLGIMMLSLLVESFGIDKHLAPLIVITVTIPIMYTLTKYIFSGRKMK